MTSFTLPFGARRNMEAYLLGLGLFLFFPLFLFSKKGMSIPFGFLTLAGLLHVWRTKDFTLPVYWKIFLILPVFGLLWALFAFNFTILNFQHPLKVISLALLSYPVFRALSEKFHEKVFLSGLGLSVIFVLIDYLLNMKMTLLLDPPRQSFKNFDSFLYILSLAQWGILFSLLKSKCLRFKLVLGTIMLLSFAVTFLLNTDTFKFTLVIAPAVGLATYFVGGKVMRICFIIGLWGAVLGMPWIIKTVLQPETTDIQTFKKASFQHRLVIWDFLADQIIEDPFALRGLSCLRKQCKIEKAQEWKSYVKRSDLSKKLKKEIIKEPPFYPHNMALQAWHDFGLLGALMILVFFTSIAWMAGSFNDRTLSASSFMLLSAVLIPAFVSFDLWSSRGLLFGCVIAAYINFVRTRTLQTP